jgi:hypothetical protein
MDCLEDTLQALTQHIVTDFFSLAGAPHFIIKVWNTCKSLSQFCFVSFEVYILGSLYMFYFILKYFLFG